MSSFVKFSSSFLPVKKKLRYLPFYNRYVGVLFILWIRFFVRYTCCEFCGLPFHFAHIVSPRAKVLLSMKSWLLTFSSYGNSFLCPLWNCCLFQEHEDILVFKSFISLAFMILWSIWIIFLILKVLDHFFHIYIHCFRMICWKKNVPFSIKLPWCLCCIWGGRGQTLSILFHSTICLYLGQQNNVLISWLIAKLELFITSLLLSLTTHNILKLIYLFL